MEYIRRELERKFLRMSAAFKAVMVTGARQVGKSTMLRHLAEGEKRTYVSMDNVRNRELARTDPGLFFQTYRPPILIDEIQKAPELFEPIKVICDNTEERGLFWLTGSESRKMTRQAGDSLAGRVCILKLFSLSMREMAGVFPETPLDFSFPALCERARLFPENNIVTVFSHIWRGGMPEILQLDDEQSAEYWNSYIETYLMRDAVDDNGIADTAGFRKFLRASAAFCGQLLNYSDLAAAAGVSGVTAKEWMKVLQAMGIVFLLEPYSGNELKRLVKTPKLYFCDTGLCAYLSSWTSRDALMNGAVSGHFFENCAVGEFLRTFSYGEKKTTTSFYRDKEKREIDLVIEQDGVLHPIEIKKTSAPDRHALKSFDVLKKTGIPLGAGGVVCMAETPYPIDELNSMIPVNLI